MWDHVCPLGVAGSRRRRLSELEILSPIIVHNQQPIASRLYVVLNSLAPRSATMRGSPSGSSVLSS